MAVLKNKQTNHSTHVIFFTPLIMKGYFLRKETESLNKTFA